MILRSDLLIKFFEIFAPIKIRAITLFPFIVISSQTKMDDVLLNHERIHLRQQLEMLIIPFYILYLIEGIFKGYRNISFEKEAFANEADQGYLRKRKLFAFVKYYRKKY
ncbi:MAG: hypothetical protein K0Q95_2178 [Bacteroidota bacterium]|jgi:hypothetical protein|nr:hypothetical protein [Bacteroidota bacterium]